MRLFVPESEWRQWQKDKDCLTANRWADSIQEHAATVGIKVELPKTQQLGGAKVRMPRCLNCSALSTMVVCGKSFDSHRPEDLEGLRRFLKYYEMLEEAKKENKKCHSKKTTS